MTYSDEQIDDMFTYHSDPAKVPHYENVNKAAKLFFRTVQQNCPDSADRSAAFRMIREARMTANAAIALEGKF